MPLMCGVIVGSTWSPDSSTPSAGSKRHRWSAVWPGVCIDTHSRPASVTISASSTFRVGLGAGKRLLLRIASNRFRRSGSGMYSSPPHGVERQGFGAASSSGVSSSVGSHQVRNSSWVMSSAPTSLRTRPAPPK